jgi:predicted amidohydrolase
MTILNTLLVQAQLSWKEPARNRDHLEQLVRAAPGDIDLAVIPEAFTRGHGRGDR